MRISTTQQLFVLFAPLFLFVVLIVIFQDDNSKRNCPKKYETIKSDHVGSRFQALAETRAIVDWQKKSESAHKGYGLWHNASDQKMRCNQISAVYTYCRAYAKPCLQTSRGKLTGWFNTTRFRFQS